MIASLLGLSGLARTFILAGIAISVVGGVVAWLRWDAVSDERARAAAANNAAVIEVIKKKNEIETEIENATDDDLRDLLGISPSGRLRIDTAPN